MEKIEEYEKLRKIKLYGKKDVKSEEFPLERIASSLSEFQDYIFSFDENEVKISIEARFYKRHPETRKTILNADYSRKILDKIERFSRAYRFPLNFNFNPQKDFDEIRIERELVSQDKRKLKNIIEKFIDLLYLIKDEISFSQILYFVAEVKPILIRERKCIYSKEFESQIDKKIKEEFSLEVKPPYKEAYSFRDIFEILNYYENEIPTIILPQVIGYEVSLRCLRPKNFNLIKELEKVSDVWEYRKLIEKMEEAGQVESYVRRKGYDKQPIEINEDNLREVILRYLCFEFIPCRHPKNLSQLSQEEVSKLPWHVVIDFDNRQRNYEVMRDYVNIISSRIEEVGIKGILFGTGTKRFGSHFHFFVDWPENFFIPAKTQTSKDWFSLPYGRRAIESLKGYLKAFLLKVISEEDLDCGIEPQNPNENAISKVIAEVNLTYRTGAKAIGSLNSSVRWGLKAPFPSNRMPETPEEYRKLTSRKFFVENLSFNEKIAKFEEERKYSSYNLRNLFDFLPVEEAQKIYSIYTKRSQKEDFPRKIRWIIRKALEKD